MTIPRIFSTQHLGPSINYAEVIKQRPFIPALTLPTNRRQPYLDPGNLIQLRHRPALS